MILEIAGLVLFLLVAFAILYPMFKGGGRQDARRTWPRIRTTVIAQRVRIEGDTGSLNIRCGITSMAGSVMARKPVGSEIEIMVNPTSSREVYLVERELPTRFLVCAPSVAWTHSAVPRPTVCEARTAHFVTAG